MKKESKKNAQPIWLKVVATLMLAIATILVHVEYITDTTKPSWSESHVMKVRIETGDNANIAGEVQREGEEKALDHTKQDNEIAAMISEDFKNHVAGQEKLEQYRAYLSNVVYLSKKFLQHEDYEEEVEFLLRTKNDYPHEVLKVLQNLKHYRDEYLTSKDEEYNKFNLGESFINRMINKIVNIEKKNPQYEVHEVEYMMLKSQLDSITAYFYSKEFLQKYLGND